MSGLEDIARDRASMLRRIEQLNRRHCNTAKELQATMRELVKLNVETWRQGVVIAILGAFSNLVRRTPVDTGRARAGWRVSNIGANYTPPQGDYSDYKNNVSKAISGAIESHGDLSRSDVIWIYNNVEYILALDAGWSKRQAGNFIGLFLDELKTLLDRLAEQSRR